MEKSNSSETGTPVAIRKEHDKTNIIMTVPKTFRAFDVVMRVMYSPDELERMGVVMTANGKLLYLQQTSSPDFDVRNLVPLWFSGMFDQRDIALFEGDICEIDVDSGFGVMRRVGIMRWSEKLNNFSLHFNGRGLFEGGVTIRVCKRIGNEYQDKDAAALYAKDNNEQ